MKPLNVIVLASVLVMAGCAPSSPSPDTIRHNTEVATSSAVRDTKAVAQGLVAGLKPHHGPLNINTASSSDLQTLPGMDADTADRVVANRPYRTTGELVKRHLISHTEYEKLGDQITAQ